MSFTVKTIGFEGPLDLLLDLIEKRKLFINDISLAGVTDEFIEHIKQFENMPMAESAHFILVASTLLLIKSKSLLPELNLTTEEKDSIHDLENRLTLYNHIRQASLGISKIFGKKMLYFPSQNRPIEPVFAPDISLNLQTILHSILETIHHLPKKDVLSSTIVNKVISLEEMINTLTKRIASHIKMSFKDFSKNHNQNKLNIIVSFLAMLELVKRGIVHVSQEKNFADIHMETRDVGIPIY